MIPSRALVLLAIAPLALGLATLADRTLLWPMIAADLGIALIAAFDALLARRPLVTVKRSAPPVLSIGRPNAIELEVRSSSRRRMKVALADDLFDTAKCEDLPVNVDLPPRGGATARYHVEPTRRGAHTLGAHHARYASPLGLWIRQVNIDAEATVKVYPDVQAVRVYDLMARQDRDPAAIRASRIRGGESEFERLREYRRGDEFRSIDWKATARRQKLISREYQLESTSRRAPATAWASSPSPTSSRATRPRRAARAPRGTSSRRATTSTRSSATRRSTPRSSTSACASASGASSCSSRRWSTTWPPPSCSG
jgi:uncharacterized protein (DUF58 family)